MASFWDFDWGTHMHVHGKTPYKPETILATAYEDARHMKGIGVGWDEQIHFIQSDDFFASAHGKLASCGNQFEIAAHKVGRSWPEAVPLRAALRYRAGLPAVSRQCTSRALLPAAAAVLSPGAAC